MILKGTKFQIKVWEYLKTIPKGKVKTYKQVAIGINKPKAARTPYAPKVPCHRVIRSDCTLGGFSRSWRDKNQEKTPKKGRFFALKVSIINVFFALDPYSVHFL